MVSNKKGGAALTIEDVFSTYLHKGTGVARDIVNGIDLVTNGGMVWVKDRGAITPHGLYDTERGALLRLASHDTGAEISFANSLTAFNTDGFAAGTGTGLNELDRDYVTWVFRKAPKFFDVVTYTGTGAAHAINHSLEVAPGMVIVKNRDQADPWQVYHSSNTANPETDYLVLNTTAATVNNIDRWNNTAPTSTQFTVGTGVEVNTNTENYVAYLFAHDTSSDSMIKCGTFLTDAGGLVSVSLGWEPQYLMVKNIDTAEDWLVYDSMRGIVTGGVDALLSPNLNVAETAPTDITLTADGFDVNALTVTDNYIYMAIRRPMKTPELATEVFAIDTQNSTGDGAEPGFRSGFPVDMLLHTDVNLVYSNYVSARLTQGVALKAESTAIELADGGWQFGYMNGAITYATTGATKYTWMFKRATGFFDVVAYTGTGAAVNIPHSLGVVPEMMWAKQRSGVYSWTVWHKDLGSANELTLDTDAAAGVIGGAFDTNVPTSTELVITDGGGGVNASAATYVVYLFATLAGISKVGSFTGNGGTQTIDCGFTAGARFVIVKSVTDTGNWLMWDSVRGIVAADDPHLVLNSTAVEITTNDSIDPENTGFIVNLDAGAAVLDQININAKEYIFYAVT